MKSGQGCEGVTVGALRAVAPAARTVANLVPAGSNCFLGVSCALLSRLTSAKHRFRASNSRNGHASSGGRLAPAHGAHRSGDQFGDSNPPQHGHNCLPCASCASLSIMWAFERHWTWFQGILVLCSHSHPTPSRTHMIGRFRGRTPPGASRRGRSSGAATNSKNGEIATA